MHVNESHDYVKRFICFCRENIEDGKKYATLVRKRIIEADKTYIASDKFERLLRETEMKMIEQPLKIFFHLRECLNEIKGYITKGHDRLYRKRKRSWNEKPDEESSNKHPKVSGYNKSVTMADHQQATKSSNMSTADDASDDDDDDVIVVAVETNGNREEIVKGEVKGEVGEMVSSAHTLPGPSGSLPGVLSPRSDSPRRKGSASQLRKLEKLLETLSREIVKCKNTELSYEDLCDSNSRDIIEDQLERKLMKVWNKICEVKGRSTSTGRYTDTKFNYAGSRYPEINRSVSRFINKTRSFPDYHDVLKVVRRTNKKHSLQLSDPMEETLARETFRDVGKQLQQRRQRDLVDTIGSKQSDEIIGSSVDPAEVDAELREKLKTNKKTAATNMDDVIDKYSMKETDLKLEAIEAVDSEKSDSAPSANDGSDENEDETNNDDNNDVDDDKSSEGDGAEYNKDKVDGEDVENSDGGSKSLENNNNNGSISSFSADDYRDKCRARNKDEGMSDDECSSDGKSEVRHRRFSLSSFSDEDADDKCNDDDDDYDTLKEEEDNVSDDESSDVKIIDSCDIEEKQYVNGKVNEEDVADGESSDGFEAVEVVERKPNHAARERSAAPDLVVTISSDDEDLSPKPEIQSKGTDFKLSKVDHESS